MRRFPVLVVVCLLLPRTASGEDGPAGTPQPLTVEQAADAVDAAVEAANELALRSLAQQDDPDPWLVADELLFRGEPDAATAFARAAPRKATEVLPAYVTARKEDPTPTVSPSTSGCPSDLRKWVLITLLSLDRS